MYQADHVETWPIFPDREREDACSVHLSLYVREPVTTEPARAHWAANLELALEAVDSEDFRLEGSSAALPRARWITTYGRNEPALIHFDRTLQGALDAAS